MVLYDEEILVLGALVIFLVILLIEMIKKIDINSF